MPTITQPDNALLPSPQRHAAKDIEANTPLMAHFASASLSGAELARPAPPWLPQRVWMWLANRSQPMQSDTNHRITLAEEEAHFLLSQKEDSSSRSPVLYTALALLGATAIGALAWHRFGGDSSSDENGVMPGHNTSENALSNAPRSELLVAHPETTTRKQCLHHSLNRPDITEWGPCPDEIAEIIARQDAHRAEEEKKHAEREKKRAEEEARKKAEEEAKRKADPNAKCWFPNKYGRGGGSDKPGLCRGNADKVVYNKNKKRKHKPTTTTPEPPPREPIKFYMQRYQPEVCRTPNFLARCENVHANFRRPNKLVLQVHDVYCYCPPPQKNRSWYKIVYLPDDINYMPSTTTTQYPAHASKIKYYQKKTEPEECQDKNVLQRCENMHNAHPGVNSLLLPVQNSTCYCPPPQSRKDNYMVTYLEDEINSATTPKTITSTAKSIPSSTKKPKPQFFTKKTQPDDCKDINFLARCENVLSFHPKAKEMILKNKGKQCYCPPPEKKRKQYEIIYLDVEVDSSGKPVTEPVEKVVISLFPTIPTPTKRREQSLNFRLPDEASDKLGRPLAPPEKEPEDDVKVVQLFDLACIEARDSLSWSDIARVIGETLESPVTKLSEESAIVHSWNTGKGCPPPEELENMRAITSRIDQVLSLILQMLPHAQPIRIAQNLIGPGLQIMADDLDGIKTPHSRLTDFVMQLTQTARDMIPTLTTPEKMSLYSKPGEKDGSVASNKKTFTKRFIFRAGKTYISVGGKEYPLRSQSDEKPYIIDDNGRLSYVQFNKDVDQWGFIEEQNNIFYSDNNNAYAEVYGINLAEQPAGYKVDVDYNHDFVTITPPNKAVVTGVFVGNEFVPATLQKSGFWHLALTNTPGQDEIKSLKKTPAGWVFDALSTKMDEYLQMLLESKPGGVSLSRENLIAPINDLTGFSASMFHGNFIKYKEKYYKVNLQTNGVPGEFHHEVDGFSQAKIKFKDDAFMLENETNMLFPLRTTVVDELFPRGNHFLIESGALNYIFNHAEVTVANAETRLAPGVYIDKNGKTFFAAQHSKFIATTISDREIAIKGDLYMGHDKDIILWLEGDTWYRVRDEPVINAVEYEDVSLCREKKAPGAAARCLPVMIERNLHQHLQKHITRGTTSSAPPAPEALVEDNAFNIPFLYKDTTTSRYYFLYDDHYFDAKIIEPDDLNNPTGSYALALSGKKTFFSGKPFITNIITEKVNNKMQIKTMSAYTAERIKTHKNIADNYVNKRPWRDILDMSFVEEAASSAKRSANVYVELNPDRFSAARAHKTFSEAWNEARVKLYPQRILSDSGYYFNMFPLSTEAQSYGVYEQKALQLCVNKIHYIQDKVIPRLIAALSYDAPGSAECEDYIAEVLQSSDRRFNNDVMLSLSKRLQKMDSMLTQLKKEDRIIFSTALHHKERTTIPDRTSSVLMADEKSSGHVSYIPENAGNNLFINIDKTEDVDFMSALLYGIAQAEDMTKPLVGISRDNGIYVPIKDAIKELTDKMKQQALSFEEFKNLKTVSKYYLEKVAAYKNIKMDDLLDQRKLAYVLQNDPGYQAHILLNSSEFLTLMTQDLYHRVAIKQAEGMPSRIDNWMKKYGEQRAFINIKEKQPVRTDLTTEEITESILKTTDFDGAQYLAEAQRVTEIKEGIENPLRLSDIIATPVADFMAKKGFSDIRYRAMALFISSDDGTPVTHFAVVGKLHGKEYVFDLAAGEFAERYRSLAGPVILPEQQWAQKYSLLSDNLLIKYADFTSLDAAQHRFNQHNKFLYWGPEIKIPDARVLRRPEWYFPPPAADTPALPGVESPGRLGYTNPVREAARLSQLSAQTSGNSWNYAVKVLENAELITQGCATELRAEILRAVDFMRFNAKTPGTVNDLLINPRIIETKQQILRVNAGELLIFMGSEPGYSAKGSHPVHVMVSTGNGRFAGIQNSILNASFDDGKMILTAEQLGEFVNGLFKRSQSASLPEIQLIAGYPRELKTNEYPDLRTLAERTQMQRNKGKDIAEETARLLRVSGELSAEQSIALAEVLQPLLTATENTAKSGRTIQSLLYNPVRINSKADLSNVQKGQLVIFGKPSSSYAASHAMYSLGYGEFVMVDPPHLTLHISSPSARIESSQFPENIIKEHRVYAGEIALDELRITSLLGQDSKFVVKNNVVKVTAHGAISNAAFMDAPELADVIRGLGLRENPPVDWSKIEKVELNTCYSALGRLPLGKAVAYLLQKKVSAWPRLYSEKVRDNPAVSLREKVYLPEAVKPEELLLLKKQATRNYYFWHHMLHSWFYRSLDHLRKKRDAAQWENMFKNVFAVANGNMTVDNFLTTMPEYKRHLITTPELFAEMAGDPVFTAEQFAERCMDIIYLSRYTEDLADEYLSQLD
ncbi:hypothetical protein [Vagococcus sp. WN89Y]|uniref:hypothetical protein n=1 Tax=Vagococcus sp. WN89Y TaxID=3457258 RepID=UPI003FCE8C2E